MLDYKKLLGDKYNEGLKPEEILALLNSDELNLANLSNGEYVAKGKFDAREAEIANLKKTISEYQEKENASLTDAQKKDLAFKSLQESNAKLAKEIERYKFRESIINSGFTADECNKIIDAQDKGENVAAVYADILKTRTENAVKSARAEMTKTTTPPAPQGSDIPPEGDESEDVAFARNLAKANTVDTKGLEAIKGAFQS